jgi:hypothetical protein
MNVWRMRRIVCKLPGGLPFNDVSLVMPVSKSATARSETRFRAPRPGPSAASNVEPSVRLRGTVPGHSFQNLSRVERKKSPASTSSALASTSIASTEGFPAPRLNLLV